MWCLLATTFRRWKKLAPVGHNQDFLGVQNRLSEGDSVWGYSNFLCTTSDQQWQTSGMKTWESGVQHRYERTSQCLLYYWLLLWRRISEIWNSVTAHYREVFCFRFSSLRVTKFKIYKIKICNCHTIAKTEIIYPKNVEI